jgi:hypothetical protein
VSARLIFTAEQGGMVRRSNFNGKEWRPALAVAGLIPPEADENGKYESAREHGMHALRHFCPAVVSGRAALSTLVREKARVSVRQAFTGCRHEVIQRFGRSTAAGFDFLARFRHCDYFLSPVL